MNLVKLHEHKKQNEQKRRHKHTIFDMDFPTNDKVCI